MNRISKIATILLCVLTCVVMLILGQVSSVVSQPNGHQSSPTVITSEPLAQAASSTTGRNLAAPLDFQGRMLVTLSDADMVASAYVDRQLGSREGQDALGVIPLGGDYRQMRAIELLGVTNSVAGPPSALTVSPDGRWAFAVESFKPATEAARLFTDLEAGTRLIAINLLNPSQPRIHSQIDVGTRPETVEINPAGDMLLVTLHPTDGRQLAFVPWNNGEFGTPFAGWI